MAKYLGGEPLGRGTRAFSLTWPTANRSRNRVARGHPGRTVNPSRVDSIVDLTYGLLIAVSVSLIMIAGNAIGLAFGFGVLISYIIHVVWKMSRFDPDWMTTAVKETVEETVDETVEEKVGETVEKTVDETVSETVEETVEKTVDETVSETVEETVGETVEKTVDETVEETVGETVEKTVEETLEEQLAAAEKEEEEGDSDTSPDEDG
ncbi:hypothetical protein [Halorarum halobium]|uniref:hypothetical protein n=1 Tax=Halorarum halobium TaxID=3075121 RepID=UPI0028A80E02|nr:hypothetical protein [Halobaculum sp. XH14]